MSQPEYARIIGSLIYLMNCMRPDIAYAVHRLSRYTHNPSRDHWTTVVRVLRYLKGTINIGIHYTGYPSVPKGFCDANWITCNDEINSTSGYLFTLGGGTISWRSTKQTCKARSTMESEFIALELAGGEAEWVRNILADIPLWSKPVSSISLYCDCQATIARAKSKIYNGKSRHIRLRHNIVKQLLSDGVITLDFVKSKGNLADPLTKGLSRQLIIDTSRGMGLKPIL